MDLTIFTNGWSVLALFIMCWCIIEIVKQITFGVSITRSIKHLKDIPDEQRDMLIKQVFNRNNKEGK